MILGLYKTSCDAMLRRIPAWIVCFFLVSNVLADEPTTVSIAFSESDPPTSFSSQSQTPQGILPELAQAVFALVDDYKIEAKSYPWARAKLLAEKGLVDGLLTYPSKSRQTFMIFTETPTYTMDYGYIIFSRTNKHAKALSKIEQYEMLKQFVLVTEGPETVDSWEEENFPKSSIRRIYKQHITQMFHEVFLRNSGDFFIRNLEEAKFVAAQLGYTKQFAAKKVKFKTDNLIPFHLGIRKSHPRAQPLIAQIEEVQGSAQFKEKYAEILSKYR